MVIARLQRWKGHNLHDEGRSLRERHHIAPRRLAKYSLDRHKGRRPEPLHVQRFRHHASARSSSCDRFDPRRRSWKSLAQFHSRHHPRLSLRTDRLRIVSRLQPASGVLRPFRRHAHRRGLRHRPPCSMERSPRACCGLPRARASPSPNPNRLSEARCHRPLSSSASRSTTYRRTFSNRSQHRSRPYPLRLRVCRPQLCSAFEGALSLHPRRLRQAVDRSRFTPHRLLHQPASAPLSLPRASRK